MYTPGVTVLKKLLQFSCFKEKQFMKIVKFSFQTVYSRWLLSQNALGLDFAFFGTLFKSAWNCFLTSHNCLSTSQDTVNSTFQNRCLQFIGFAGHFGSPACAMCMQCASASPRLNKVLISTVLQLFPSLRVLEGITRKYS